MSEWVTPIKPLTRDEMWCIWEHAGIYEWMAHPAVARRLMATGITIDGEHCPVELVDEWPGIGAWQIVAKKASAIGAAFVPLRLAA